jgi:hypothetical protein
MDGETEERLRPEPVPSGLQRGGIEEHGIVGTRVSAEAFPKVRPKHLRGFSGYLASHASRSGFGLSKPSARMDGEPDRTTVVRSGCHATGTRDHQLNFCCEKPS